MENINSYIACQKKRVSIFNPINDVDAMILARFSYLPFHKIKLGERETIGSICQKMTEKLKVEDFAWPDDYEYVQKMFVSKRFKNMRVTDYVRKNSEKIERQFSAVTIHTTYYEMYLSFFGTDDTLVGWKEDFNLAFLDVIPAQKAGAEYLAAVHRKYPTKLLRLGGHSKGGNIAMYSAITAKDSWQRRMLKIYNFDGPGLRKGTAALDTGSEKVLRKIRSFIPQGSVIGRLFEHKEKVRVVKSVGNNLYQHDLYTWQISGKNIVPSSTTKASDLADKTITNWLESASKEDQKIFINSIFKVFASANVNTPLELKANFLKFTPTLLKAYRSLPKEQRKVIMEIWKKLAISFMKARKEK
ncbi:DUF2974 domain-containing protein [Candidatus Saccharibacteria bacterium]|nr:DUF2974 domain-containing protein [Candidatus Saccharibacteria bacterium]